jgi:hypothetical protein
MSLYCPGEDNSNRVYKDGVQISEYSFSDFQKRKENLLKHVGKKNKYTRTITNKHGESIDVDVYDVLEAFDVRCSALQHIIKKSLCAGLRGHKTQDQDLQDIIDSAVRAKELHEQRKN